MKLLTRELVESLDLIVASPVHPAERQDIESVRLVSNAKVMEEWKGEQLKEAQIFAAVVGDFDTISPYLSRGTPKRDDQFIYGYMGIKRIANAQLCLPSGFENSIGINDHSVYYGLGESSKALVFEKPIPLDPKKELMLVRSPNRSVNQSDILGYATLRERIILGEWLIINEQGRRVAQEWDINSQHPEQRSLTDRYLLSQFETNIRIVDEDGKIKLTAHIAPPEPAMKKTAEDSYHSIPGRSHGEYRKFYIDLKQLNDFDPLKFNPENIHLTLSGTNKPMSEDQELYTYGLIYASPAELVEGKNWAFNDAVTGRSPKMTRYQNRHLMR
jgi:hypothetical protein